MGGRSASEATDAPAGRSNLRADERFRPSCRRYDATCVPRWLLVALADMCVRTVIGCRGPRCRARRAMGECRSMNVKLENLRGIVGNSAVTTAAKFGGVLVRNPVPVQTLGISRESPRHRERGRLTRRPLSDPAGPLPSYSQQFGRCLLGLPDRRDVDHKRDLIAARDTRRAETEISCGPADLRFAARDE
jgi:hypothetical protein